MLVEHCTGGGDNDISVGPVQSSSPKDLLPWIPKKSWCISSSDDVLVGVVSILFEVFQCLMLELNVSEL